MARIRQRYGFPFKGYRFLTASHLADRHYIVGDATLISQGWLMDPIEGKLIRRGGASSVGSETGLLESVPADVTARGIQILSFNSSSLTDGYPTHLILFADESKAKAWLYWRSTNGAGFDLNFAEVGSSSNHYGPDESVGQESVYFGIAYESNGMGMTRGVNEINRGFFVSGSRRLVRVGSDLFSPGYTSSPACWRGMTWNDETGSGTTVERFGPTGLIPPLCNGRYVTANLPAATTTNSNWKVGDQFYSGWAFMNEHGEVSMPYIGSGTTGTAVPGGAEYIDSSGLVTVPGTAGQYVQYLRETAVRIGPGGTVARLKVRSQKVDSTQAGAFPNRLKLFVAGIIRDNTTTQYDDYAGNDLSLVDAPELVRLDRKWPDRARSMFTFDQRLAVMYCRRNPYAILFGPTGSAASRDQNKADTDKYDNNTVWCARVISGTLQLRVSDGTSSGSVTGTTSITIGSSVPLRKVVDDINATIGATTNGREWAAQLAPGVSEDITSDNLLLTYFTIAACTSSGVTLTTSNSFANVAVGMKVTGSNIAANTYVKAIASATSLTLSVASTGDIAGTAGFNVDFGDDGVDASGGATLGNMRTLGNAWPIGLPFKKSYLDTLATLDRDVQFTTGGPLDPPYAGNSYVAGNRRNADAAAGFAMGGAPLLNGAITCYSRAYGRLYNVRGGKTGEDADYRNEIQVWSHGCVSPYSIVYGNGWVGFLTDAGFVVTDGTTERIISLDVYNPSTGTGEWAYEIGQCKNAAETNGSNYQFHAFVEAGKLYVSYRRTSNNTVPAHMMVYDFSASASSAGLAQVLRPDGTTWGWSTNLTYSWRAHSAAGGVAGAIGSVRKSTGLYILTCDDTNDKTTCGLVQRIENGTWTDSGTASQRVTAQGYLALDMHDTLDEKAAQVLHVMRYNPGAAERVTFFRSKAQSNGSQQSLAASGAPFQVDHIPLPIAQRTITMQTQILLEALGGSGSTDVHYHGAELELETLPAYRTTGG